jgi:hypothetical protein
VRFGGFRDFLRVLKARFRSPERVEFPWPQFEFVVAATTGLYLCSRTRWHRVLPGPHYGITFEANALLCFQDHESHGRIVRIDRSGHCRIVAEGLAAGPHVLDRWEGRVFAADGWRIRVFDISNWEETDLLGPVPVHDDACAITGLHFRNGKTYLVCDAGDVVIGDRAFQPETSFTLPARDAHNIAFLGPRLLVCDSGGHRLIDRDGPVAEFDGAPRGLAVSRDAVAVGISDAAAGRLVFLDHGFSQTGTLEIPGEINDVRCLFRYDGGLSEPPDPPQ